MPTSAREIVASYFERQFKPVFWPAMKDWKGPREEQWATKEYTLADWDEGKRVGLLTGVEIAPKRFLVDIDIDWSKGAGIAAALLPPTEFVYGRKSKTVSHAFYTCSDPLPLTRFEDIDHSVLLELRGTKKDGSVGLQSMVPPSIWENGAGLTEPLQFVKSGTPGHYSSAELLKAVSLVAITMLFAKHFGKYGFGHEVRLAWAGFLLRAGISPDEVVAMGEAISVYCENTELKDVRIVVDSTVRNIAAKKKVVGGPGLIRLLGPNGRSVVARVNTWLGADTDFVRNKDGAIVAGAQENIRKAFQQLEIELGFNEYSEKFVRRDADGNEIVLNDDFIDDIWLQIDREFFFRPNYELFRKMVKSLCRENIYHPVREYLGKLVWDGKPRLDTWLINYAGAKDSPFVRAVSAIVLIAAVRRVRTPGCKYDEMLVLESGQGLKKSSALRALCPVNEWFSDDFPLDAGAKEVIENTVGKWIIEASDLAGKRRAEVDQLKSMLSRQVDGPARMAYAFLPTEKRRQFIIIGTTNSQNYLVDMTGARRFWPVRVKEFDVDGVTRDRDQLWAEAAAREANEESIRLDEALWPAAAVEQEKRREEDLWEEPIIALIKEQQVDTIGMSVAVVTQDIWTRLGLTIDKQDERAARRLGGIMMRLGGKRVRLSPWRQAYCRGVAYVRSDDDRTKVGYEFSLNPPPDWWNAPEADENED